MNIIRSIKAAYLAARLVTRACRAAYKAYRKSAPARYSGNIVYMSVPEITEKDLEWILEGLEGEPN